MCLNYFAHHNHFYCNTFLGILAEYLKVQYCTTFCHSLSVRSKHLPRKFALLAWFFSSFQLFASKNNLRCSSGISSGRQTPLSKSEMSRNVQTGKKIVICCHLYAVNGSNSITYSAKQFKCH